MVLIRFQDLQPMKRLVDRMALPFRPRTSVQAEEAKRHLF